MGCHMSQTDHGGRTCTAAFILLFVSFGAFAEATPITIGSDTQPNAFPFGAPTGTNFPYLGEYQQIYAATAFSGPVWIWEVAFASAPGGGLATSISDTFILSLGTTSTSPSAPGNSYSANKGADFTQVFAGTITATLAHNNTFDFVIPLKTPFTYNPLNGNLLLDVFVISETSTPELRATGFAAGPNTDVGKILNFGGTGNPTGVKNDGLLTQFSVRSVPEPASLLLLGISAVSLGGYRPRGFIVATASIFELRERSARSARHSP